MIKLKPCPFCGKEVKIKVTHDDHYVIECDNCNSATSFPYLHSRDDIINAWNTRPNPWHTGTPTEEGWYLIKVKLDDEIVYDTNYLTPCVYGMDWRYAHEEILKWKKLEENEDGVQTNL